MKPHLFFITALLALPLAAGPRTSANYRLEPETIDGGGGRSSSTDYTLDGSLATGSGGSNTPATPPVLAKSGYIGQLYEVASLAVTGDPGPSVAEGGTLQLGAMVVFDDSTLLAPAPASVAWSVAAGPLTGIDAAGLATAGLVWQDSPATAEAAWGGITGQLALTVLDTDPDNFGSYAGDGLADDWQHEYFGADNPLAGPDIDADGDGNDNHLEFVAGVIPIDPLSLFRLSIHPVPGQPSHRDLVFSPRLADRDYAVEMSPDLMPPWLPLGASSQSDSGEQRTVTDLDATDPLRFYRINITRQP